MGYTKSKEPFVGGFVLVLISAHSVYVGGSVEGSRSIHSGWIIWTWDAADVCLVSSSLLVRRPSAYAKPSAEAVASMIIADMEHKPWVMPTWLPDRYLTKDRL